MVLLKLLQRHLKDQQGEREQTVVTHDLAVDEATQSVSAVCYLWLNKHVVRGKFLGILVF